MVMAAGAAAALLLTGAIEVIVNPPDDHWMRDIQTLLIAVALLLGTGVLLGLWDRHRVLSEPIRAARAAERRKRASQLRGPRGRLVKK